MEMPLNRFLLSAMVLATSLAAPATAKGSQAPPMVTVRFDFSALSTNWVRQRAQLEPQKAIVTESLPATQDGQAYHYYLGGRYPQNSFKLATSNGELSALENPDLLVLKRCESTPNCWDVKPNLVEVPLSVDDPLAQVSVMSRRATAPPPALALAKGMLAFVTLKTDREFCVFVVGADGAVSLKSGHEFCEGGGRLRLRARLPEPLRVYNGEPHTVRWEGAPAYQARGGGSAYDFKPRKDYDVKANLLVELPKKGAISVWVNPLTPGAFLGVNLKVPVLTPSLFFDRCFGYRVGRVGDTARSVPVPEVIDACAAPMVGWHHVVLTWASVGNGSDLGFFVDGCPSTATRLTGQLSLAATSLGSAPASAPMFTGQLDQVEVFDEALTPAMVKELCQHGEPGACRCTPP